MKKIKSLLLAGLIVVSSIAGITTVSAATPNDTSANLYVSDTIEGTPAQTPVTPAVTANVGDIIEVSVTAKAKKDVTDICSIDIRTYFNQPSSDSYETYDGNGVLKYTDAFYGDSFYQTYDFPDASTITNPSMETYPSDYNRFIYTMSSVYNKGDFTSTQTLYSFTLEVVKSGDAYINTAVRDLAHAYPGQSLEQENDLLDIITVINIVKQAEIPTVPTETQPITDDTTQATEPTTIEPTEEPTTSPVTEPTDSPTTVPATDSTEATTEVVPTVPVVIEPTEKPTDEPTTNPEIVPSTTGTVPDTTETTTDTEKTSSTESTTNTQAMNPANAQTTKPTTPVNNSTPDTATKDTATPDTTKKNPTNTVTNNNGAIATGQTLPAIFVAIAMTSAGICMIAKRKKSNIDH